MAKATSTPAHRDRAASALATVEVRALAESSDEPTATTITPRSRWSADAPTCASRCPRSVTSAGSSPSTSACLAVAPEARIASGRSTLAWNASASNIGTTTAELLCRDTSARTSPTNGAECARKAACTSSRGRSRRILPARALATAAERGSALPWAARISLGGQERSDQGFSPALTTRAVRTPSWPARPSGRCADRRRRSAWRCTVRIRSTDSPRRRGD